MLQPHFQSQSLHRLFTLPKRLLKKVIKTLREHPRRVFIGAVSGVVFLLTVSFLLQPTIRFNFGQTQTCADKFILFPGLHKQTAKGAYEVSLEKKVRIAGVSLFSRQACVRAVEAPAEQTASSVRYALFGNGLFQHRLKIRVESFPKLDIASLSSAPISARQPLMLGLSEADSVFDFAVSVQEKTVMCQKQQAQLACSVGEFGLKQGKTYDLTIDRHFQTSKHSQLFTGIIKTAEPVEITRSSIKTKSTAYHPVKRIRLTASQPLKAYEKLVITQGKDKKPVTFTAELQKKDLLISFEKPLDWRTDYRLELGSLQSEFHGDLPKPFVLEFKTAGGPKVTAVNAGTYGVSASQDFSISFDQSLKAKQAGGQVSLRGSGGAESASVTFSGSKVLVNPSRTLARCTSYTITVGSKLVNTYDVGGDSAWSYRFRTRCAETIVIGYSTQGRAIVAHRFGTGSSKIVFVGGMHGNEQTGTYALNSWLNELEANAHRIPARRSIVVIPNSNPDGVAHNTRTNARNVDLNRNFPADDWKSGVYMPGPVYLPKGGGAKALSEPESKALASYITSLSPRLVLTYHGAAAVIIGNGSGDSNGLAALYASKARYQVANDSQTDAIFGYATTGEFEDWLHDKLGIPALLVEMATTYGNEYARNLDAMWAMVTLP